MKLDRFTFNQHWLERLNTQAVKRWRTVQQNWVLTNYLGQDIPNLRWLALDHFLGSFDGACQAPVLELAKNKWLEEFEGHFFGQTALVKLQGWTRHDHRTARVVNTLSEEVLTETALLTFDHVSKRLQWTLVRARDRAATTTVIQQCVDRLLEHTLLVAHDDIGSVEIEQTLESIVTVDNASVQIVEV